MNTVHIICLLRLKCTKIIWQLGSIQKPHCKSSQWSSDPLAGFRGATLKRGHGLKGECREGVGKVGGMVGEEEKGKGGGKLIIISGGQTP